MNEWIGAEERYPDDELAECRREDPSAEDVEVIVMIEGGKLPTTLYYDGEDFTDNEGNAYRVTYWMPMPEPPREPGWKQAMLNTFLGGR